MTQDVEDLTREELEEVVLNQAARIVLLDDVISALKMGITQRDDELDKLGSILLQARVVLSC